MEENNNQDSRNNSNWYDNIDPSLASEKLKGFTNSDGTLNLPELLKSYNAAQSLVGSSVRIPSEKSSADEISAFYSKLGRPESADKYDWKVPEGYEILGENFKAFKEKCFDLGMSNKQVSGVLDAWLGTVKTLEQKQAADLQNLQKSNFEKLADANVWGDKARENIDFVQKKFAAIDDGRALEKLKMAGLDADPDLLLALFKSMEYSNGSSMPDKGAQMQSTAERIASLQSSPAYTNQNHPEHAKIVSEINSLLAPDSKA